MNNSKTHIESSWYYFINNIDISEVSKRIRIRSQEAAARLLDQDTGPAIADAIDRLLSNQTTNFLFIEQRKRGRILDVLAWEIPTTLPNHADVNGECMSEASISTYILMAYCCLQWKLYFPALERSGWHICINIDRTGQLFRRAAMPVILDLSRQLQQSLDDDSWTLAAMRLLSSCCRDEIASFMAQDRSVIARSEFANNAFEEIAAIKSTLASAVEGVAMFTVE